MGKTLVQNSKGDEVFEVDDSELHEYAQRGYKPAHPSVEIGMHREAELLNSVDGTSEAVRTFGETAGDFLSFGGLSAAQRGLGVDPAEMRARRESHDVAAGLGTAAGLGVTFLATGGTGGAAALTPAGAAAKASAGMAARGGAGRAALAYGLEGAAHGVGGAITDISLSDDPVTVEKALSTLGTGGLYGGLTGGAAGVFGKALEKGVVRANKIVKNRRLDKSTRVMEAEDVIPSHLQAHVTARDSKALNKLRAVEKKNINAKHHASKRLDNARHADEFKKYFDDIKAAAPHEALLDKSVKLRPKKAGGPKPHKGKGIKKLHKQAKSARSGVENKALLWETLARSPKTARKALEKEAAVLNKFINGSDDFGKKIVDGGGDVGRVAEKVELAKIAKAENDSIRKALDDFAELKNASPEARKAAAQGHADRIQEYNKSFQGDSPFDILLREVDEVADAAGTPQKWRAFKEYAESSAQGAGGFASLQSQADLISELADNPMKVVNGLAKQSNMLRRMVDEADELKAFLTSKGQLTDDAVKRIDSAPEFLKRNEDLRLAIKATRDAPLPQFSDELLEIENALKVASAPKPKKGLAQGFAGDMMKGGLFAGAMGVLPGGALAYPAAAWIANKGAQFAENLVGMVSKRMTGAAGEQSQRINEVIQKFVSVSGKAGKAAGRIKAPTAVSILSDTTFAPGSKKPEGKQSLHDLYQARAAELRELVEYDQEGNYQMRMDQRQKMAERFEGIKEADPKLYDMLETQAANKAVFLANQLPKVPDAFGMGFGRQVPRASEMEMRQFALAVWATENPIGVLEKAADGTLTPVEAESIRTLTPNILSEFEQGLMNAVEGAVGPITYSQKISLSILMNRGQDPSLHPSVLRILQSNFLNGPENNGMDAPAPAPQFGSVTRQDPTMAQERGEG